MGASVDSRDLELSMRCLAELMVSFFSLILGVHLAPQMAAPLLAVLRAFLHSSTGNGSLVRRTDCAAGCAAGCKAGRAAGCLVGFTASCTVSLTASCTGLVKSSVYVGKKHPAPQAVQQVVRLAVR